MATSADYDWVTLTRRTEYPKLGYIINRLGQMRIPTRISRRSWHAPILEVPRDNFNTADELLGEEVQEYTTLDEIPDDHWMFRGCDDIRPDFDDTE